MRICRLSPDPSPQARWEVSPPIVGGMRDPHHPAEFVSDPANQPVFDERFSGLFIEPRVTIEARIDGDCAAVRFHEGGESEMEPWTGFLCWEEGEWHLQSVTLIPDAITLLSAFCLG